MRIVVSANGPGLEAAASSTFGRCAAFVFVDPDTMETESLDNPAMNATGGAGIQAAQFVVEQEVGAVVTGNVGPNAFGVLDAAHVPAYRFEGGTVGQAVERWKEGGLPVLGGSSAPAHAGMGGGRRAARPGGSTAGTRAEELDELKQMAAGVRRRLAEITDKIDELEKGA